MKKLLLSGLVFAAMSSAAVAAEPLTEQQMDTVTAGLTVAGPFTVQTLTVTPTTFRFVSQQFFIVSNDELYTASFLQALSGIGSSVFMVKNDIESEAARVPAIGACTYSRRVSPHA
jgi:hypothetical protein